MSILLVITLGLLVASFIQASCRSITVRNHNWG